MKTGKLTKRFYGDEFCIFCDMCKSNLMFAKNGKGICTECFSDLPFTPIEGSFSGGEYVKYLISPFFYRKMVKMAIKRFKFKREYAYGDVLGKMMMEYIGIYPHLKDFDAVTAVPLSKERLNERGYNQSRILAEYVCKATGVEYCDCVKRIRNTKRQSSLSGGERTENVKNAFKATDDNVRGKRILLVDDICTTGSTLNSCAKALLEAGAKEIIAISCAYAQEEHEYNDVPKIRGKKRSLWKEFLSRI